MNPLPNVVGDLRARDGVHAGVVIGDRLSGAARTAAYQIDPALWVRDVLGVIPTALAGDVPHRPDCDRR
jgi:hypothetical protein